VLDSSYLWSASFDNTSATWTRKAKKQTNKSKNTETYPWFENAFRNYCLNSKYYC
jgi:hypothetical protein